MKNVEVLEMVETVERIVATRQIQPDQVRTIRKFAEIGSEKGTVYQLLEVVANHLQTFMVSGASSVEEVPTAEHNTDLSDGQPSEDVETSGAFSGAVYV